MSENMDKVVIKLVELTKIYEVGVPVKALDNVNLEIRNGEFVSIVGPSGSGKSTLLNMIGCMDKPTYGKVYVDEVDVTQLKEKDLVKLRAEKIGFVFQMFNLISTLTALENVQLPMLFLGKGYKESLERAALLLRLVGLWDRMNHRPLQLSGGQRQRVAIARALANDPPIILADEPTGNLDSKTGQEIIEIMREINEVTNKTFVIVTHDLEVAEKTDRIIFLKDGKVITEKGKIEEKKSSIEKLLGELEKLKRELLLLNIMKESLDAETYNWKRTEISEKIMQIEEEVERR